MSSERFRRSTASVRERTSRLPHVVIGGERRGRARIVAVAREHALQRRDIAEAEVQPLRADRRKEVRRLADQHRAPRGEAIGERRAERKDRRPAVEPHGAVDRLRARPRRRVEKSSSESAIAPLSGVRPVDPDEAHAIAGSGTSVKGPFSVWNSVETP